ncbi:MAG: GspE/PulE family protein [Planctomycetota bacterium]|nr:GspE/PulE family protein [Planctomycetota bacterium]
MAGVVETSAVALVDEVLARAVSYGASDVHLDPTESGLSMRFRKDGVLGAPEVLPLRRADHVVGRLKALADLLAYRTDLPQEGRIAAGRAGVGVEVRVSTFPTLLGERVALRFDTPDGAPRPLCELGIGDDIATDLRTAIEQPEGVVLLTGPSGSGKTTTLYSCLRHLATAMPHRSLFSLEDPVERRVDGVTQTEVRPVVGLTFARALRSLLRQDPDVLLVGEIRDLETARIALEAGLTGHLVLATIHAGTAPQVFSRLLEMKVEPFVLTTAVRGVLSQRLLRRRDGDAYAGRVAVAEWLSVDGALREAILRRADGPQLTTAAVGSGYRSLKERARDLVATGETTPEEVQRVLGDD